MKYAIMTYETARKNFNIGDYIQSLAAAQYLPQIDYVLNREKLDEYDGEEVKMIMNGWFMSHPEHWPPSPKIKAHPVAFHMEAHKVEQLAGKDKIEWYKKHEPFGCRDSLTLNLLKERGVNAWYTGCLTLTLGQTYQADKSSGKVYFVDVLCKEPKWSRAFSSLKMFKRCWHTGKLFHPFARQKALEKIFAPAGSIEYITQNIPCVDFPNSEARFEAAKARLTEFSHAKLVVTSRIHCALPCLAMGTPVIFIAAGFAPADTAGRVGDFFELFNTIYIAANGEVSANFDLNTIFSNEFKNPDKHLPLAKKLIESCKEFIANS